MSDPTSGSLEPTGQPEGDSWQKLADDYGVQAWLIWSTLEASRGWAIPGILTELDKRREALLAAEDEQPTTPAMVERAKDWVQSLRSNVRNHVTAGYSVTGQADLADVLEAVCVLVDRSNVFDEHPQETYLTHDVDGH